MMSVVLMLAAVTTVVVAWRTSVWVKFIMTATEAIEMGGDS